MNLLLREIKTRVRALIFWILGTGVLTYAGMVKFEGFTGPGVGDLTKFMESFPKIVLAMFGMVGIDILKLPDYYTVIGFLVMLCGAIYAVNLGTGIVTDEIVDKNADFLYTRPRTRKFVFTRKLLAALVLLLVFSVANFGVSKAAVAMVAPDQNIDTLILQYSVAIFLINAVFLSLGTFVGVILRRPETAKSTANRWMLLLFLAGVAYDVLDNASWIRYVTPFRWFEAPSLLANGLEWEYVVIAIGAFLVLTMGSWMGFVKRDIR